MKGMSSKIEIGEEWFIVSMKWIKAWQEHVGFDNASATPKPDDDEGAATPAYGPNPGKIDNTDIIIDEGKVPELEE